MLCKQRVYPPSLNKFEMYNTFITLELFKSILPSLLPLVAFLFVFLLVKKILGRNRRGSKLKGNDFELQIGREWQDKGYKVIFEGINKGFKDGGIDLIVKKDKVTNLIQCKYWNPKGKLIRENVIHQFFGAIELYKGKNPNEQVEGVIVTTANLSREAKDAARFHNIGITKLHYPYP